MLVKCQDYVLDLAKCKL